MIPRHLSAAVVAVLGLSLLSPAARPALADDPVGIIRGTVFADTNENRSRDADEPLLGGIELELANGESVSRLTTADDGTFAVQVGGGTWRVTLHAPEGYAVLNDASREVTIAADGTIEAVMDFALKPPVAAEAQPGQEAESGQMAFLPESGARLPYRALVTVGALASLLMAGALLVVLGRLAVRR